jgi:hypothetical protein
LLGVAEVAHAFRASVEAAVGEEVDPALRDEAEGVAVEERLRP